MKKLILVLCINCVNTNIGNVSKMEASTDNSKKSPAATVKTVRRDHRRSKSVVDASMFAKVEDDKVPEKKK